VEHRSPAGTMAGVAVCGVAYVVYYLIFGGMTYRFFTKGYDLEAAQIASNLGLWFWAIQFARGVLMTVAVLPVIYTLRRNRGQVAIAAGIIIWVAGGLAPLLMPNPFMGTTQRMIHIVETLTQNASLGITAALLLRRKTTGKAVSSLESRELLRQVS
jgi:multisubunit Na+/H+ antiporter MnhB subunit